MKLLLATDGSPTAGAAVGLVAALTWPTGSTVRVMTAFDSVRLVGPWTGMPSFGLGDLGPTVLAELTGSVERAAEQLVSTGMTVEHCVVHGRPSAMILDQARDLGADLIVMGSRGLGPIRTMLLGSVSAEVVDQARCPVLVARGTRISRVILGHDGSDQARAAEDALVALTSLAGFPVEVLSVVRTHEPGADALAPGTLTRSITAYGRAVEDARMHHEQIARSAAARLEQMGRAATWSVRTGGPARTIVAEAASAGADLVIMGTHGRTGLDRLALGSVARNVLTHVHCSVLIVRTPGRHATDATVRASEDTP